MTKKLKTLKDFKQYSDNFNKGVYVCSWLQLKQEAIKRAKKINLFFNIENKLDNLRKIYYKGKSQLNTDLEEAGKLEEYNSLRQKQDKLLQELNLKREYEDFGDETFLHLHTFLNFIKEFFNITDKDLK